MIFALIPDHWQSLFFYKNLRIDHRIFSWNNELNIKIWKLNPENFSNYETLIISVEN